MAKVRIHALWKLADSEEVGKASEHIFKVLSLPPEHYRRRLEKIGFLGRNTKFLDAGCGAGYWAIVASYLNQEVKGIDSTEKYLNVAKKLNGRFKRKNLQLVLGRLEKLPYRKDYFDLVFCYNAWMYTKRPESLKEMYRVLRPGGKIYLGCISGLGWYLLLFVRGVKEGNRGLMLTALKAIKNRVFMTKKEALKFLKDRNLQILEFGADGQIGQKNIKIKPVYSAKFLGFWNIYEILAEKIIKKERNLL